MKNFTSGLVFSVIAISMAQAQTYTSYLTPTNATDTVVTPDYGICLMGGGVESDPAMIWFLEKANGGDILVIRTSGSNGYNNYMYEELGVDVNSVETIVFHSADAANDPYVIQKLNQAEAIWIAGGDQSTYVDYWKDSPVAEALNNHVNVKGGAIGGTSAGMAILGEAYFSAINGTITSAEAMQNPFHSRVTIGFSDFVSIPQMNNTITDTHFNLQSGSDRYGRLMTFMARLGYDHDINPLGIGANNHSAVVISEEGIARAFGEYPEYPNEKIYFLQPNCEVEQSPETIVANQPLTWNREQKAVKVYELPATMTGENYFDLNDRLTGEGGTWQDWYIENGVLTRIDGANAPDCITATETRLENRMRTYPNPANAEINIYPPLNDISEYRVFDSVGKQVLSGKLNIGENLNTRKLQPGSYILNIHSKSETTNTHFIISR